MDTVRIRLRNNILETVILISQNFNLKSALKTAFGMSFISMLSMEIAMNLTDYFL
ncbi:MAG TPA: DUF4396 domain-containing protein, partial [Desulfobacterales bacterium]|nr:DUF4396 domain-containing protein [Desulfobacterales bacterium]